MRLQIAEDGRVIHFTRSRRDTHEFSILSDEVLDVDHSDMFAQLIHGIRENGFPVIDIFHTQQVHQVKDDAQVAAADAVDHMQCERGGVDDMVPHRFDRQCHTVILCSPHHIFKIMHEGIQRFLCMRIAVEFVFSVRGSGFLKKEDCVDLPEKVFETRTFSMAKKQNEYYADLINDIKENINQWSKFEFTAKLMKLREVTSGFVINKDQSITVFGGNKEKLLDEVLSEIGNRQIIVWCQFQYEIDSLAEKFGGIGLTSKTKNRDDIIRQFKSGDIKLLFTHPKLIGKGLTFVKCSYCVYYSMSFSYEEFKQSQDRIHRIGQNNKCTYIILQAKDSIEERIYDCVQRKGNAVDELYLEMGMKVA